MVQYGPSGGLGPVILTGTPSAGELIEATSPTAAEWTAGGGGPPTGAAGGDLSGTYPDPVVSQIDGQALPLPLTLGGTGLDESTAAALLAALGALQLAQNLSDVASAATARTNLGVPGIQAAPAGFHPGNPTATASTSLVMMGLGSTCVYTPSGSGLVLVTVTGTYYTATAAANINLGPRYGLVSGGVPANGNAVTGTRWGTPADWILKVSNLSGVAGSPFCFTDLLDLTLAEYWFDLALLTTNAADSATITNLSMTLAELP